MSTIMHPSVEERTALGRAAREKTSPSGHSGWVPARGRPDPVGSLWSRTKRGSKTSSRSGTGE